MMGTKMDTLVAETTRDVAFAVAQPVAGPTLRLDRGFGALVILCVLFDGVIRLVPWPIVTETTERMGYGSSESLARWLGAISLVCTALCGFPPTSFVGAILMAGYLGSAFMSHLTIGGPLFTHLLFGFYVGIVVWGGLWLREKYLRDSLPLAG